MGCSPQCLARTVVVCNVFAWVLGITVFGLSVGTVRNEVFKLGIWAYLKPLWDMACADIAAGVFICIASVGGCFTVAYRTSWMHVINISSLIFLFAYTMCVGIATLVICEEKTEGLRRLSIIICMSTWGVSRNSPPSLPSSTPSSIEPKSGAINAALNVIDKVATSNIGPDSRAPFGLDVFKINPIAKTYQDCDYFNDLMTPCGALLIVMAIVYLLIIAVSSALYHSDEKNRVESKPRNQRDNVAMNQV